MFSFPDNKEEAFDKAEMLLDGVNAIAMLVGGATSGNAAGVVTVIRVVLATLKSGLENQDITPEQIREELSRLTTGLENNDAAADKSLADKFGE